MLKFKLLVWAIALGFQTSVKTGNAYVQKAIELPALPADVNRKIISGKLCLIIPEKDNMVVKNKSRYIKCYLVNNTSKPRQIRRADGSLADVSSEVFEKGRWKIYQESYPVFCGNSYWSQKLESGRALVMHYDYTPGKGSLVQLRVVWDVLGETFYSNSILVQQ